MMHILSVDQFSARDVEELMFEAWWHSRESYRRPRLAGKILTNLFYEPSTRTSSSFYSAMVRLGGHVIPINDVTFSSVSKGETLEDTIRTLQCYCDAIVLRHKEVGAAERAAKVADIPIINAGDGTGEHPTQALLDFFTILYERGWDTGCNIDDFLDGLTVTMMGDLKHGRTVKSLSKLLRNHDVKINWVSPEYLRIPSQYLKSGETESRLLEHVMPETDVLYVTRAQKERFVETHGTISYGVTLDDMKMAKPDMVLMHPLPRQEELPAELDKDPRAAYFRQMKYGLWMRMAILKQVMRPEYVIEEEEV